MTQAEECKGIAILSFQVNHGQCKEFGEDARCLNAIIKGEHPLQVVRISGPESSIGALAAVAAHPYVLLRAAELRQVKHEQSYLGLKVTLRVDQALEVFERCYDARASKCTSF